jgi:hypothetical protein
MLRRAILLALLSAGMWSFSTTTASADPVPLNENFKNPIGLGFSPTGGTLLLCDAEVAAFGGFLPGVVLDPTKTGKPGVWACGEIINQTTGKFKQVEPSDSIVFSSPGNVGQAVFCSNVDTIPFKGDMGDSPCTPPLGRATVGTFAILEQGKENEFESFPYKPEAGQPGYGKMGTAVQTYTLVSDANKPPQVPEPSSSLWLLGTGVSALALSVLRKSRGAKSRESMRVGLWRL